MVSISSYVRQKFMRSKTDYEIDKDETDGEKSDTKYVSGLESKESAKQKNIKKDKD